MAKPTWRPERPAGVDGKPDKDYALCQGCGWRSVRREDGVWCGVCLGRARELGGPREAPPPLRVPTVESLKGNKTWTPEQKAWMHSFLPVSCKACGAGGHASADCPVGTEAAT